jgi:YCII-related domain
VTAPSPATVDPVANPDVNEITDEFMLERLAQARAYTLVLLKATAKAAEPDSRQIIWEHGRRNFALRAEGKLAIVCPVSDDSELAGIGIFDATQEEVARILDGDPGVKAGIFTYELHPVRGFPGSELP